MCAALGGRTRQKEAGKGNGKGVDGDTSVLTLGLTTVLQDGRPAYCGLFDDASIWMKSHGDLLRMHTRPTASLRLLWRR